MEYEIMRETNHNSNHLAIADHELIVDNFAGGGGASLGIGMALGRSPDIAINHDPEAIAMHAANHPETKHYCEDVWHVNPVEACDGRPVGLAWFSPDCKHFSKAKGGKPVSKKIRGLAWVVIRWAKAVKPRVIILENVEEFQTWGPLTADGMPCPLRKGQTFRRWKTQLENLGYQVSTKELRASDYGTPTIRKRLFIVARCDGLTIRWPEATHGDPKKIKSDLFSINLKPWRTAAECIDWSLNCPSIFERERPLAENTLRRIAAGIRRFVIESSDPFIVNLTHHGSDRVESLDEPFRTITGANRGEKALVIPSISTYYGHKRSGEVRGIPLNSPLPTQTTENRHALLSAVLVGAGGPARSGEPRPVDRPIGTQMTRNNTHLVSPILVGTGGPSYSGKPRTAGQPIYTMTTDSRAALVSAFLAKHYTGVVGSDLDDPLGTVTASDHHSLVTAHIQRDFGASVGHPASDPLGTVTGGGGGKSSLVSSHLLKLYGTCKDGQPVTDPIPTIRAGGTHLGEVRAFLLKYFGTDQDPRLEEPLHTVTSKDRFGLVTVLGEEYVIADIGLRMLSPPELYRAQGFPEHYLINPEVGGKRLSKTAQVRMCGNSVCPPIAAAVARAQFEAAPRRVAA
jgi:DNA (cytosine-5)-methyltransferase 1